MTFKEAYSMLEADFQEMVQKDRDLGLKCIYLPNIEPEGPVDYILVGMEPSLGGWAKGLTYAEKKAYAQKKIDQGFRNFCGVWTVHHPARNYLCREGKSYYVTDLAQGAMLTTAPGAGDREKYERWYPLFEKELGLVAKPDAKIISIGDKVGQFLSRKNLPGHAGTIPHYSAQAAGNWGQEIPGREAEYEEFAADPYRAPRSTCAPHHSCWPGHKRGEINLSDSRKKLMFDYKVRFERIQDHDRSGWPCWRREWQRRMAARK